MNLEHLFEIIYSECNPTTEKHLKHPIDDKTKPLLLFEEIYFECNMKPLFEQILLETENNYSSNQKLSLSNIRKIARNALSSNIVKNEIIQFTRDNYNNVLNNPKDPIETPIENVTMGENIYKGGYLFDKMTAHANRQNDIFKIKTTLKQPSIIIKSPRYQNGYIYAKVYDDSILNGNIKQIFSVIVDNWKVISSYNEDHVRIRDFVDSNIRSPESLIWSKQIMAATPSDEIQ